MPNLDQLPVPEFNGDQPYHWEYDNLPPKTLADRDDLINSQVDAQGKILADCIGTQGTLANRLAQSIDDDGNLLTSAVDEALHNIAKHEDGSKTVTTEELDDYIDLGFPSLTNPVEFVRMLASERDKLALIADNATNMTVQVTAISQIVLYEEGPIELIPSESIVWEITSGNKIKPRLAISTAFAHRHYYDLTPVMISTPSTYKYYKVNSSATPYIEGSLRVYINGIRLNKDDSVYYPSNPVSTWSLNKFTEDYANGKFTLANAITGDDIIQVDFDISLT